MANRFNFRAWDRQNQRMVDSKKITPLALTAGFDVDGIFIPFTDDLILMQSTGLVDKDSKEIFEGDILDGHDDGNVSVVWRDGETQFDFADEGNIGVWEMPLHRSFIIGNIYENSDLI